MIEEKDTEISRLLDEIKNLRQSLESKPPVCLLSTLLLLVTILR